MRTVLVEGSPVLGGNGGSEKRVTMVGACGPRTPRDSDANAFKMDCREGGIVEEYQLHSAATNPDTVPSLFSLEIRTLVDAESVAHPDPPLTPPPPRRPMPKIR